MNIERLEANFPRDTRGLPMHLIIALHFAILHTFRPLGFVMMQQLSTSLFDLSAVLRMTLSVDNSRGLTFYLPKQQPVRNLYTM
jgi:hypothetical protein